MNIKSLILAILIILGSLYLVKVFDISYPLTIVSTSRSNEMAVVGEGKVEATADTAYIDAGISVINEKTIDDVQKNIDITNNNIIQELQKIGIKKEEIKTANYSINPDYSYEPGGNKINGYNGNVSISIKITNIHKVTEIISTLTRVGANQINGVRFVIDSPEKLREKARDKAITNAKEQADKLAKKLDIKLGKITNIIESNQDSQIMPRYDMAVTNSLGAGPQIEPGTQTITSIVTLYFEKK